MKAFLVWALYTLLYIVSASSVFAASITLSSSQTHLENAEELHVSVVLSINASDGTEYYLRGVFYTSGTTQYCGYTLNSSNWYNGPFTGEGFKQLPKIAVMNKSWTGELTAKLDTLDSSCQESGVYKFKVLRYTSSGASSSDDMNELDITAVIPTLTPTIPPSATPTKVPTPTKTPPPIHTTTPTKTPSPSKSPTPPKSPTPGKVSPTIQITTTGSAQGVLSATNASMLDLHVERDTPKPEAPKKATVMQAVSFSPFVVLGVFLSILACGILGFSLIKNRFFSH